VIDLPALSRGRYQELHQAWFDQRIGA